MSSKIYFKTKSNSNSYIELNINEDLLQISVVSSNEILLHAKFTNVGNEIIGIKGEEVSEITKDFVDEFTDLLGKSIQKIKFKNP